MISRSALREARRLGETAVLLYLLLIEHQGQGDRCYPRNDDLATELGVTVKTIQRTLTKLRKAGLIRLLLAGNGRGRPNIWSVNTDLNIVHLEDVRKRATSDDQRATSDVTATGERATSDDRTPSGKGDIRRQRATSDDHTGPKRATFHDHGEGHIYVNSTRGLNDNYSQREKPLYGETGRQRGEHSPKEDLAELITRREVQSVVDEYTIYPRLVERSLRELIELWYQKDAAGHLKRPAHPNTRARNAAQWLRRGEQSGKHARWRREAPTDMAGLRPL